MKYIRTKDGRIIDLSFYKQVGEINGGLKFERRTNQSILFIQKDNIFKQANNLDEVCDVYVCVEPNGNHTILPSNSIISIIGTIIYGAIWTDKGLIYVAKMNEEGDLELL